MKILFKDECYAANWSLTNFYDDCEKEITEVFASGEDFQAEWGCKHEIHRCELTRNKDGISIKVTVSHDEYDSIVDSAIWIALDRKHDSGWDGLEKLVGSKAEEILTEWEDVLLELYQEDFVIESKLPSQTSYDDVIYAIDCMTDQGERESQQCFNAIIKMVVELLKAYQC